MIISFIILTIILFFLNYLLLKYFDPKDVAKEGMIIKFRAYRFLQVFILCPFIYMSFIGVKTSVNFEDKASRVSIEKVELEKKQKTLEENYNRLKTEADILKSGLDEIFIRQFVQATKIVGVFEDFRGEMEKRIKSKYTQYDKNTKKWMFSKDAFISSVESNPIIIEHLEKSAFIDVSDMEIKMMLFCRINKRSTNMKRKEELTIRMGSRKRQQFDDIDFRIESIDNASLSEFVNEWQIFKEMKRKNSESNRQGGVLDDSKTYAKANFIGNMLNKKQIYIDLPKKSWSSEFEVLNTREKHGSPLLTVRIKDIPEELFVGDFFAIRISCNWRGWGIKDPSSMLYLSPIDFSSSVRDATLIAKFKKPLIHSQIVYFDDFGELGLITDRFSGEYKMRKQYNQVSISQPILSNGKGKEWIIYKVHIGKPRNTLIFAYAQRLRAIEIDNNQKVSKAKTNLKNSRFINSEMKPK